MSENLNTAASLSRRPLKAHVWEKDPDGWYVEPQWVSERLFAVEEFPGGGIWDPAAGLGRIPEAARAAGHHAVATDIVDRGYRHFSGQFDFLLAAAGMSGTAATDTAPCTNIVCNPPYEHCEAFARRALELTTGKVAMVWLLRRLNAARWLAVTPLARIYLLTPRLLMPPFHVILRGDKPGGGTQDFYWLVWSHGHAGPPEVRWLHRDGDSA
jgi:hypothetical protein